MALSRKSTFAIHDFGDSLTGQRFDATLHRYTLLFGAVRYKADFKGDDFSCPDTDDTAFAMAFGAGLDIRASDRIDIRPIQVDYLPVFFDERREDGIPFSAGVKIKN